MYRVDILVDNQNQEGYDYNLAAVRFKSNIFKYDSLTIGPQYSFMNFLKETSFKIDALFEGLDTSEYNMHNSPKKYDHIFSNPSYEKEAKHRKIDSFSAALPDWKKDHLDKIYGNNRFDEYQDEYYDSKEAFGEIFDLEYFVSEYLEIVPLGYFTLNRNKNQSKLTNSPILIKGNDKVYCSLLLALRKPGITKNISLVDSIVSTANTNNIAQKRQSTSSNVAVTELNNMAIIRDVEGNLHENIDLEIFFSEIQLEIEFRIHSNYGEYYTISKPVKF